MMNKTFGFPAADGVRDLEFVAASNEAGTKHKNKAVKRVINNIPANLASRHCSVEDVSMEYHLELQSLRSPDLSARTL
jgi:hypothetical protein